MNRGSRSQATCHKNDDTTRHEGNSDDSDDSSEEEDEIHASRRLKRMRHLEPNRKWLY